MIPGPQIARALADLGVTHVIWVPSSGIGAWERALDEAPQFRLLRVCREGEAWPLAAGLILGGKRPLLMMQTTGLFESGDALRNVLFDMQLPVFAVVGYRGYLIEGSTDSARRFAEPLLDAWGLDWTLATPDDEADALARHYRWCQAAGKPGVVLVGEGMR